MTVFMIGVVTGFFLNFFTPTKSEILTPPIGTHVAISDEIFGGLSLNKNVATVSANTIELPDGTTIDHQAKKAIFSGEDSLGLTLTVYEFEDGDELYQLYVTNLYLDLNGRKHSGCFVQPDKLIQYLERLKTWSI